MSKKWQWYKYSGNLNIYCLNLEVLSINIEFDCHNSKYNWTINSSTSDEEPIQYSKSIYNTLEEAKDISIDTAIILLQTEYKKLKKFKKSYKIKEALL